MLPYYQKVSTEQLKPQDSRFIIHKHVMTGQWQLTEVYDYFWTRNIKAFPVTEEIEKNALLNNQFVIFYPSIFVSFLVFFAFYLQMVIVR